MNEPSDKLAKARPDRNEDGAETKVSTAPAESHVSRQPPKSAFVVAQVAILCLAMGVVSHRIRQIEARGKLPELRQSPLNIEPTYDYPQIVSDGQLEQVLFKLYPRLRGESPKINHVDHALRFWGVESRFNDPQALSGKEMRTILTNHGEFARLWGADEQPLLQMTESGVRVRTRGGQATASHVDHTVAGLAEIGTPADFPLDVANRRATMRELVHHALREFRLNQTEYEWSALTFALFLAPNRGFVTSEGQSVTFDDLAERIMRQPFRQGVCFGNHRLHTLVMMLRIDDSEDILSDEARTSILAHLLEASQRLVATQHEDGYWDHQWPGESETADDKDRDLDSARILATGHALEWLALAPREVHPPRERLVRAGQWLARRIIELDDEKIKTYYTFLTHAGRALALWRGRFPVDFLPPYVEVEASSKDGQASPSATEDPQADAATLEPQKREENRVVGRREPVDSTVNKTKLP
jgi:hypothetical protein